MNVSFTYTYFDYSALIKAMSKHGKYAKYAWIVLYLIIFANFAASAIFIFKMLSNNYALQFIHFANAAIGVLLLLVLYVLKPLYLKHYYKKQMIDGKEVKLGFSDDGLKVEMPSFNANHAWPAIIRADEEPEHFLLWINKVQAYCVPKRGFVSAADIEEFKKLVANKVENQELIK